MKSVSGTLVNQDWEDWTIQTIVFNIFIPGLLIFLTSLQGGANIKTASIVAAIAFTQAVANLYGKYKSGPVKKEDTVVKTIPPQNAS